MPLARNQDDIARPGCRQRGRDCLAPVRNLLRTRCALKHHGTDQGRIFAARIVIRHDHLIATAHRRLAHRRALARVTIAAYLVGRTDYSTYLGIPYVPRAGELAIFCAAIMGACLAFLWFNAPPAAVFMGDTGSLALGGALGAIAVACHHEIVLAIVGGLFVLEAASVIIQVFFFKRTGKRVFRMAPIHHHFELSGWPETKVVSIFSIVTAVLCLIGMLAY